MTDGDLRQMIAAKLAAIEQRDWYALLDIERESSRDEIRRAYHQLIKLLHPDRLKRRDLGELERASADVFKALTDGYQVLSNPDARKRYDREQASTASKPRAARVVSRAAPPRGEPVLPKGITERELLNAPMERFTREERTEIARWMLVGGGKVLAKADYMAAERYFRRAVELDPSNPIYALRLGWAIFRNTLRSDEERKSLARPYLESASARDAYNPEARFALAYFIKEFGTPVQYQRELEAVLRCDENHTRALQELETLKEQFEELRKRNKRGGGARSTGPGTVGMSRKIEPKAIGIRNRLRGLFNRDQPEVPS